MGGAMPNTFCKYGDRVAYKKTNDKRSKWRYGRISRTSLVNGNGIAHDIEVKWDGTNRYEQLPPGYEFEPQVIIFVPEAEWPAEVREWCEKHQVLPIRNNGASWEYYRFVSRTEPYEPVSVREESVQLSELRYDRGLNEGWTNDDFELESIGISFSAGDREVEAPRGFEAHF